VSGFHDWTLDGVHLCMTRLNLLRLNTMPPLDASLLEDVCKLRDLRNDELRELGRLSYPMLREKGDAGFRRIQWEEAYQRISRRIRRSDPKKIAFYLTSRGITNEVYYVAQKVARFLGTNNIDNAARLCHSPSTGAMKTALGVAASTCSYKDWYGSDLIIFFGANPANDQPVTIKYLHGARKLGTKVVVINPYKEPGMVRYWVPSTPGSALFGTDIMDYWFPVSVGGDIAFLCGALKVIFANNWHDSAFIERCTTGFDQLKARIETYDWVALEKQSGISRAGMEEFARLLRDAKTAVLVWSMGITQHSFGGDTVKMILNLGLSRGYVGRDQCGLMPIRGHSGVQGGAEMGAYATAFPAGKAITPEGAAQLAAHYHFEIPAWTGLTASEMVEAAGRGRLDLLYCLGGNFLRTLPDPNYVSDATNNIPLRVYQDIIVTDQMLIEPKEEVILLPARTRYEQRDGGTETTTERRVLFSPEIPRQVGEAKTEWEILLDVASAVYPERAHLLGCRTGMAIREEIAKVVPFYDGIQRLERTGDQFQYGGRRLCEDGKFPTTDGKAHFQVVPLPDSECEPGLFHVSTRRGKQFNSLVYSESDPLTGAPRDAVFMNPEDATALHLTGGDRITLINDVGSMQGRVFLAPIARGNLQVHWPEANAIISRAVTDPESRVPDYNATVRIEPLRVS